MDPSLPSPPVREFWRPATTWWIGANVCFAACHPSVSQWLPGLVFSLAVGAVLFLVPAMGWRTVFGPTTRVLGVRLILDVTIATALLLGLLIVDRLAGVVPTQLSMWSSMWLITNVGFAIGGFLRRSGARRRLLARKEFLLGAFLLLASFGFYYYGATAVVPPQRDHDEEVQATGYALATRLEPFLLTDRHTIYYFAHPPLLHFYVAASFLYYGAFPDLEYYDAASRRALNAREGRLGPLPDEPVPDRREGELSYRVAAADASDYLLVPIGGGPERRVSAETVELALITRRYDERPHLIETRAPNLFLASLTVALLGIWSGRISRRVYVGLLVAVAYATNPEVFVRSSYGGYFAIGAFTGMLMLLAVDRSWRAPVSTRMLSAFLAGVLAALSDHKMVLLPAAAAIVVMTERLTGTRRSGGSGFLGWLAVGFAVGTTLFWCFGLATAPGPFLEDHVYTHLVDRIRHENPLGYGGYPTIAGLWCEFLAHSGYVLLPVSVLMLVYDLFASRDGRRRRPMPARGLWLLWMFLVAAVFSIIDWRMTKHLVPILLPLSLGLVPDRQAAAWRTVVAVVTLLVLVGWNAWSLGALMADIDAFTITPTW